MSDKELRRIEKRIEKVLLKMDKMYGVLKNVTSELESIQDEIRGD